MHMHTHTVALVDITMECFSNNGCTGSIRRVTIRIAPIPPLARLLVRSFAMQCCLPTVVIGGLGGQSVEADIDVLGVAAGDCISCADVPSKPLPSNMHDHRGSRH